MMSAPGARFAVLAARWNDFVVQRLLEGALDALRRSGVADEDIEVFRCPGALELPGLARRVADTHRFDGLVCLGVVIRGATPHFDVVVGQSAAGLAQLSAEGRVALGFGVLACETIEQAIERAGSKGGNRGFDAALVAVEMVDLYRKLPGAERPALAARLGRAAARRSGK